MTGPAYGKSNNAKPNAANRPAGPEPSQRRRWTRSLQLAVLVSFFALPAAGGLLNLVAIYFDSTPEVPDGLDGVNAVASSPDGSQVFTTANIDSSVLVFARDATNELLFLTDSFFEGVAGVFGLQGARGTAVTPDGRTLLATSQASDALAVFSRDASNELITFEEAFLNGQGGVFGLDGAVAVAGTDSAVYVTGFLDDALAVFVRDASTDQLSFLDAYVDGVGGVSGLAGAFSVAADASNSRVFATGQRSNSLVVFARNASTEELTQFQQFEDGVSGVDGLASASGVARSPDGNFIYVAGAADNAVAVFRRGAGSFYSPFQVIRNGVNGVEELRQPVAVAASPDGRYVLVTTRANGGISVLQRIPGGQLAYLGNVPVPGVSEPLGIAVTADGLHVLVAGRSSDSLAMLRLDVLLAAGFESGNLTEWTSATP